MAGMMGATFSKMGAGWSIGFARMNNRPHEDILFFEIQVWNISLFPSPYVW
jgi:hypothetical protein